MPIIIEGYITVSTKVLREHEGHSLYARDYAREGDSRTDLWCDRCLVHVATEPAPREPDLPCGCADIEGHNADVAVQAKLRRDFRIHKDACVGCVLGDDGISIHSCVIHDKRYWPEA